MDILKIVVVVLQVISAIGVIGLVLVQHGKGADAGAAFGSGASGTVFGSTGSANFLSRTTAWLATAFVVCTVILAFVLKPTTGSEGGVDLSHVKVTQPTQSQPASAPVAPNATNGIPK